MNNHATQRLFIYADRAFWLIWLAFPILVWLTVRDVLDAPATLAAVAPQQQACLQTLPLVVNFSQAGQVIYWLLVSVELGLYVVLLGMAHRVIHTCAVGRVFVADMIGTLRLIGWIITLWPVADLILSNLAFGFWTYQGDLAAFVPNYALDLPVVGVGMLLIVMAQAMQMAIALHRDAELTI